MNSAWRNSAPATSRTAAGVRGLHGEIAAAHALNCGRSASQTVLSAMIEKLTIEDFASIRGTAIMLRFGDERQDGEVIEVRRAAGGAPDGREPFSVIVRSGDAGRPWPQGMYVLEHPQHGELELFMVPIGPDEAGMRYELTFS